MIKRGRLSNEEDRKIGRWIDEGVEIQDIAEKLGRSINQIEAHVRKYYGKGLGMEALPENAAEVADFLRALRRSPHWTFLKQHYNSDELTYYETLYAQLMTQFKDDILPSEELQVLQALDVVVLINRHKKSRKEIEDKIVELEREIGIERSAGEGADPQRLLVWENQKQALQAQSQSRTREFTELAKKFDETIGKLKATREQRIKNIESSKQSWTALIKTMQDRKVREREGRIMQLVKHATDQAEKDLQKPHKYVNGQIDQPLLQPEHILIDEEEIGGTESLHGDS